MDTDGNWSPAPVIVRVGTKNPMGITGIDFHRQRNQRILPDMENPGNINLEKTTPGEKNRIYSH